MNDYQMNNEFLKSVMEGMGVQPTDNMLENWNTIMNFVPSSPGIGSNFGVKGVKNGTNIIYNDEIEIKNIINVFKIIINDKKKN